MDGFLLVHTKIGLPSAFDYQVTHAQLDVVNFTYYLQLNLRSAFVPHVASTELVVDGAVENVELLKTVDGLHIFFQLDALPQLINLLLWFGTGQVNHKQLDLHFSQ